jgi:CheR methyltransferase, SAM binding domain
VPTHLVRGCGKRSRTLFNRHLSQRNGERDRGLAHRNTGDRCLRRCAGSRSAGATANSKYSAGCRLSCWSNISRESTSSGRSLRKCAPWSNIGASISLRILRRLELFDVILCRNVLIYLDQDTKSDVLRRLAEALSSDGYLVLGAAETAIGLCDRFKMVSDQPGLYTLNTISPRLLAQPRTTPRGPASVAADRTDLRKQKPRRGPGFRKYRARF